MKRIRLALPLAGLLFLAASGPAEARTFERKLKGAAHITSIAKVIGPFLQQCGSGATLREIQCRAIRSRMQHRVRHGTYWTTVPAVRVGAYDNTRLNFPVSVVGCLTCNKPTRLDTTLFGKKRWYVTTGVPKALKMKEGLPMFPGLELKRLIQPVGPSQVEQWMRGVLPNLQVQMIYKVRGKRWPARLGSGMVVKLVGYRLYNRCTGKVLASKPRSEADAPASPTSTCAAPRRVIAERRRARQTLPNRLASRDVQRGMRKVGPLVQECYDRYQVPGLAVVLVTVKGDNGRVLRVKVKGKFKGSPTTGKCLVEAVKKARFRKFLMDSMSFRYRWFLR